MVKALIALVVVVLVAVLAVVVLVIADSKPDAQRDQDGASSSRFIKRTVRLGVS